MSNEAKLVHAAYVSPAERRARAAAGAQMQAAAAAAATKRRAQKSASAARMKAWQEGAEQAVREQQLPKPLTLAAFLG